MTPTLHGTARTADEWLLNLGWPKNPLPANGPRKHFAVHAAEVKAVRQVGYALGLKLRAADGGPLRLDRAEIGLTQYVTTKRRRDADNLVPLMKPLVDGLVDARIFPDDNDDVVTRTFPRIVPAGPLGTAHFELTIRGIERSHL